MNTVLEIVPTMQKIPKPEYENCVSEEGNINTTEIKWLFKISWDHLQLQGDNYVSRHLKESDELLLLLDFYDTIVHWQKSIIFIMVS